jgi:cephalosporin-C deacetylase-like acetyl esterase
VTISQYKKQLENYSGQTQTPEDFSQHWNQALESLGGAVRREPVPFSNPAACYETLTLSTSAGEIRARCVYPAEGGTYPLVLMYHDLNRGPRGWHHMTRFIAMGCAVVAPEAPADNTSWVVHPHDVNFHQRYLDVLVLSKAALELPYVDKNRVITWGEGLGGGLAVVAAALLPG